MRLFFNFLTVLPLRSKKAGRFEKMLRFDSSHPILTRVSRTPPEHTLPAFLKLDGRQAGRIFLADARETHVTRLTQSDS